MVVEMSTEEFRTAHTLWLHPTARGARRGFRVVHRAEKRDARIPQSLAGSIRQDFAFDHI